MSDLIERHLAHIVAAGYSHNTVYQRRHILRRLDEDLQKQGIDGGIETVLPEELIAWLAVETWSAQTRASYRGHLVGFYRWAVAQHILDYDPSIALPKVRRPKGVPRPCTDEDLELALRHLPEPWRWYALIAACQGLRCAEIAALRREDISPTWLTVRKKGGGIRLVRTHRYVWQLVADLPAGRVASHLAGRPITAHAISDSGARALDDLGLHHVTMHQFRHWYGSDINRRLNTRVAQECLGHASIESTQVYTRVNDDDLARAVDGLPIPYDGYGLPATG